MKRYSLDQDQELSDVYGLDKFRNCVGYVLIFALLIFLLYGIVS